MNHARGMYAAVCSGCFDTLIFKEPVKETNLCFWLQIKLCPLSLHGSASPTTAIRVSTAQIKCKQSDLTSWWLTAETSLLGKPFFCQRQTASRLWGKNAYCGDGSSGCRWRKYNWTLNGLFYYFNWSFRPVQNHWYFHSWGKPVIVLIFQRDECGSAGRAECCALETETWQSQVGNASSPASSWLLCCHLLWINDLKEHGKKEQRSKVYFHSEHLWRC